MTDDVDLYDDLPLLGFGESLSKIDEERQLFKKQLHEKEKDLNEIKEQYAVLVKEKKTLEENISSLYKTAVTEIKRKDQVIEELRREKDSLIFRRKSRQNHNNNSNKNANNLDRNHQSNSTLPAKLTAVSDGDGTMESVESVKSVELVKSVSCNSEVNKQVEESKHQHETVSCKDISFKESDESKCTEGSILMQELNEDHNRKTSNRANTVPTDSIVSENTCKKSDDASSDNLSTCSSYSHRNSFRRHSRERSWEYKYSTYERERRSLSSESRRDNKHKSNSHFSQKYCSPRKRYRSPHSRHRSRLHNERNRKDMLWDHGDRKHKKDLFRDTSGRDRKFSVGSSDEIRGRHLTHSRRSPSPQRSRRHSCNTVQGYSDRRNSSKVRSIRPQSENVRLATQLKSKYSRAMRERSLSVTPIKQKTLLRGSNSETSNGVSKAAIPKLNLEEKMISNERVIKDSVSDKKTIESLSKVCVCQTSSDYSLDKLNCENCKRKKQKIVDSSTIARNIGGNKASNCAHSLHDDPPVSANLHKDPGKSSVNMDEQCSAAKRTQLNSKVFDNSCSKFSNVNIKEKGIFKGSEIVLNNVNNVQVFQSNSKNNCAQREDVKKSVLRVNENFETPLGREECSHQNISPQSLKTPPSKNLIPLKISPSFDDPAIVKENKFSICVFNEQCEFKRPRHRRSVKLLVSEEKKTSSIENVEKGCKELNKVHNSVKDILTMKQKTDSKVDDDSLEICTPYNKTCNMNLQNVTTKEVEAGNINNKSLSDVLGKTSEDKAENRVKCQEIIIDRDVKYSLDLKPKSVKKLSVHGVLKNRSPNKKRKLDSICEELKANLQKRNVTSCIDVVPVHDDIQILESHHNKQDVSSNNDVGECKKTTGKITVEDNIVKSSEPSAIKPNSAKRIVISKLRRRSHNLQDSVVQVLSQVKSQLT